MLRLVTAVCYGSAALLTAVTVPGLLVIERGHATVAAGWAFCTAGLLAIGRLAYLARPGDGAG